MNHLEKARTALRGSGATKATEATKGLAAVWSTGGLLVISRSQVRAVGVPVDLQDWISQHGAEVLRALQHCSLARRGP